VQKTAVLNVVGLTPSLIGEHTPRLREFVQRSRLASMKPPLPAVTSTVQATLLTGRSPQQHGVVANGWYDRDDAEVRLWRRSHRQIQGDKIWDAGKRRDATFTCANLFFMHAMFSSADYTLAARPSYPADGRKLPDCYGKPNDLRHEVQAELGTFPLFRFWGPATSIESSSWIARAAMCVDLKYSPTLSLVYLPHLDYVLQREGPSGPGVAKDLREIDAVVGELIDYFEGRGNARVIVLSEYGISAVSRPVHLNRVLREAGLIAIRDEERREILEPGDSAAFAVADHQVAHVYVNDPRRLDEVRRLVANTPGVAQVLSRDEASSIGLNHPRSGELIALSGPDAWFTYYYWLDDRRMPDFARTVDIHRKPGYDPAELFIDPSIAAPKLKLASILARKKLGFRTLMNVIPPHGDLVRGSHGLPPASREEAPVFVTGQKDLCAADDFDAAAARDLILRHVFE
jgi:predicted AlkP superfamily pyrophosphatase or phosphodiesterase